MSDYAIEATGISIGFNGVKVLHDIDFKVKKGNIHSLVGTNGAGKSTLVKILNGVYKKDTGTIKIFGEETEYSTPDAALSKGIAMVFQDLSLIPTMSVSQNIFLKTHPYMIGFFIDDKVNTREAKALLEQIGVDDEIDPSMLISNMSVGHQQLVEIAKALASNPRILILDEPTASLSTTEIERLFTVIRRLQKKGITIIYITHYLQDVFKISDEVTLIRDGKVAFSKTTKEIDLKELVNAMTNNAGALAPWHRGSLKREGQPLYETKNITTKYITDVSLSLYPGEIVGVAGLLGSGRTELFRALFGIDKISSGKVLLDGNEIHFSSSSDAIQKGISLVPENRREQGLVLDYSVSENVVLSILSKIKKVLFIDEEKKVSLTKKYIKQFCVKTQGPEQIIRFLSGGNQQKIVVAKCLASDSRVLLLDDPTFGVDLQAKREIMKIIHEYASLGNGVIMVSSEFNEIADFCDVIYIMKKGKVSELITDRVNEDTLLYKVQ